jgi:MerR-like DNA binding protein
MTTTLYESDGSSFEHGFEVLMKPADAAAILAINPRTLTNWANIGKVRTTRTGGGHRRYYASSIRAAHEGRWEDAARVPGEEDMHPSDVGVVV